MLIMNTVFQKVVDHGPWNDGWSVRNVFICSNPLISSSGMWSTVHFPKRGLAVKTFTGDGFSSELKGRESLALYKLQGRRHFPKVLSEDETSISMEYSGCRAAWLPENDIRFITDALESTDIMHRDICPNNVLWNGSHAVLVDFSFSTMGKEITNYHYDLGGKFKCPYGFNDEYSLRKVQSELIGR